ncbi:hypothetical protein FOCG_18337 [Fusarium oxysporum f. sp. radicis-lycopersici 26381]|nr:hypothetical protein FOCG_18337 [Fusarium oxysporum f. sp. radicis-lycopersici 26381]
MAIGPIQTYDTSMKDEEIAFLPVLSSYLSIRYDSLMAPWNSGSIMAYLQNQLVIRGSQGFISELRDQIFDDMKLAYRPLSSPLADLKDQINCRAYKDTKRDAIRNHHSFIDR